MAQLPAEIHELTVGQLAARGGVAVSTLHFYEAEGLITSRRTPGNQRRYSARHPATSCIHKSSPESRNPATHDEGGLGTAGHHPHPDPS